LLLFSDNVFGLIH